MAYGFVLFGQLGTPWRRFECWTPCGEPGERRIYGRIVPRLWPILVDGLPPVRRDGAFAGRDVEARRPSAVEMLADDALPHEQAAFLEAMYEPIGDPVGRIEPDCRRGHRGPASRHLEQGATAPRERRGQEAFMRTLRHQALELPETPHASDRRKGLPRVDRRHRGTGPKEADDASLD